MTGTTVTPIPSMFKSLSGAVADLPAAGSLPNGSIYFATDTLDVYQMQAGAWALILDYSVLHAITIEKVLKTADETVSNSIVGQNDDHLIHAVAANEVWFVIARFKYISTAGANIKIVITVPAAGVLTGIRATTIGALAGTGGMTPLDLTAYQAMACNGATQVDYWLCVYVGGANAGNLQVKWAQNTAEVSDTKILTNSFLLAHKLN